MMFRKMLAEVNKTNKAIVNLFHTYLDVQDIETLERYEKLLTNIVGLEEQRIRNITRKGE